MRRDPPQKKQNRTIFWRAGPLWYRLCPLAECSRNPSVWVYQLVWLWEAVCSFSEFSLKTQRICPFYDGWFMSAPAHTVLCSEVLDPKWYDPGPHPPYLPNLTLRNLFLFPSMKKVLKGKCFAHVEEVKQKNGRSAKRHQNWWVQKLFWAVKKISR